MNKYILGLGALWLLIIFGFLYALQRVYENEPTFYLYVILALSVGIGYDGLKYIVSFRSFYPTDSRKIFWSAVLAVLYLFLAFGSFLIGALLVVYLKAPDLFGQIVSFLGYVTFYVLTMRQMTKVSSLMKLSNVS